MDLRFLKHVIRAQDYEHYPLDWPSLFRRDRPIVVEIGFGSGEYMEAFCSTHRDLNYIGLETSALSVVKTLRRLEKKKIDHVLVLMTDARFGLQNLFPENSIAEIILNFPCPWSKQRHLNRRVIVPSFFSTLNSVLQMDGELVLTTDVQSYAMDMQTVAQEHGFCDDGVIRNPSRPIQTRYEKKWIRYQRDIYMLRVRKKRHQPAFRILEKEEPMPHAFVPSGNFHLDHLLPILDTSQHEPKTQSVCVYKEVFVRVDQTDYLVKTITFDGGFQQHFFIVLYRREDDWVIKLDKAANPFRTPAVKFSIRRLAEILKDPNRASGA